MMALHPRNRDLVIHSLADLVRFRLLMIASGYEDGNDANSLRSDPMFKMAQGLAPSEHELASQSTITRFENLPLSANPARRAVAHSALHDMKRGASAS